MSPAAALKWWWRVAGGASGGSGVAADGALTVDLVAYWSFEEVDPAPFVLDQHGDNDLTLTNAATLTSGHVGNALTLNSALSQYATINDNAALSMGDIAFTTAGWAKQTSASGNQGVWSKYRGAGNQREYYLFWNNAGNQYQWLVSPDGSTTASRTFGALTQTNWNHLLAYHDPTGNVIGIRANGGAASTTAHTTGVFDGTAPFRVGVDGDASQFYNGQIDELGVWKRLLLDAEVTFLYNAGDGRTWEEVRTYTAFQIYLDNLLSKWRRRLLSGRTRVAPPRWALSLLPVLPVYGRQKRRAPAGYCWRAGLLVPAR